MLENEDLNLDQTAVNNRIFFGVKDICENMFDNKVRPDLLRRMIKYCGFPAPRLPKGQGKGRVTTWGLVESWLVLLYESEVLEEAASLDKAIRRMWNRKASIRLKNIYINGMTDEEARQLVEAAERWSRETEEGRWQKAIHVHRNARWRFERKYGVKRSDPPRRENYRKITVQLPHSSEEPIN